VQRAYAPLHRIHLGYGLRPYRHGEIERFILVGEVSGAQDDGASGSADVNTATE
jgi:hypothetical protein